MNSTINQQIVREDKIIESSINLRQVVGIRIITDDADKNGEHNGL